MVDFRRNCGLFILCGVGGERERETNKVTKQISMYSHKLHSVGAVLEEGQDEGDEKIFVFFNSRPNSLPLVQADGITGGQ